MTAETIADEAQLASYNRYSGHAGCVAGADCAMPYVCLPDSSADIMLCILQKQAHALRRPKLQNGVDMFRACKQRQTPWLI